MEQGMTRPYFSRESFALFAPAKWRDLLFNKQRLEVKETLRRIAAQLEGSLPELTTGFCMELGSETPAIWNNRQVDRLEMFHLRPEKDRAILTRAFSREIPMSLQLQAPSPLYANASLGLIVHEQGLEAGWRLPFLAFGDAEVLRREIVTSAEQVDALLGALPSHLQYLPPSGSKRLANTVTHTDILADVDALRATGGKDYRSCVAIVRSWDANTVEDQEVITGVVAVYRALFPLYHLFAWCPERDQLDLHGLLATQERLLEEERRQREEQAAAEKAAQDQRRREEAEREAAERQKRLGPKEKPVASAPRPRRTPDGDRPDSQPRGPRERSSQPRSPQASRQRPSRPAAEPRPARSAPEPSSPRTRDHFNDGDEVIIDVGLLAGKHAIVLGPVSGARGKYRVRVGSMELTLSASELRTVA